MNDMCQISTDASPLAFQNLPDLYNNKTVKNVNGQQAYKMLTQDKMINGNPELVVFYSPTCVHCHKMVQDFQKLADEVSSKKVKLTVVGVNLSKTFPFLAKQMNVTKMPTIRLYSDTNKFTQFKELKDGARSYQSFVNFLKAKANIKI